MPPNVSGPHDISATRSYLLLLLFHVLQFVFVLYMCQNLSTFSCMNFYSMISTEFSPGCYANLKERKKKKKTNSLSTPQYYSTVFHCEMKIKYVRLSKIGVKRALTSKFYILDFFHYWLRVPWNTFIPLSIKQTSEEKKKKKSLLSPYFSSESRTEISFLIFKLSIPPYLFWPMPMISDIL